MAVPGTSIVQRDAAPPLTLPTDTGVLFIAGTAASGPKNTPVLIETAAAAASAFPRTGGEALYDRLEGYFRNGGRKAYALRIDTGADATAADSEIVAALAAFEADLGPGQVALALSVAPSDAAQTALMEHANSHNRISVPQFTDTADVEALVDELEALYSKTGADQSAAFVDWAILPGIAGGTTRTIPYGIVAAGLMARQDALTHPNVPAAGQRGIANVLGLTQARSQANRDALYAARGNCARTVGGQVRTYGYRTLASPLAAPTHSMLSNVRLDMAITAKAEDIAERYVFAQIDGQGITLGQFGADLAAMLSAYYEAGALWGRTADEAYRVDVGSTVNTPEALARGEIRAVLSIRRSPFAEAVVVEIVKTAITEVL